LFAGDHLSILQAIFLGVIQGLTEFLPVSSSGHLALFEHFLRIDPGDLSFEVTVHAGTLLAVLVYFRKKLLDMTRSLLAGKADNADNASQREDRTLILCIIVGSVPAAIIGLLFKDTIEALFASPRIAAMLLMVTGIWLLSIRLFRTGDRPVGLARSLWVGVAQAVAILPGVSRSGSTIATGMMLGITPKAAAEFSFLLSIPAVFGAMVLALPETISAGHFGATHILGGLTAALVGYWALSVAFATIRHGRFGWFGAYCLVAGGLATLWLW
jgi:undecaprenyl-diphosphatase